MSENMPIPDSELVPGLESEPDLDPELVDLWSRVFAMARTGQAELLGSYVDAGISTNLTNDRGDSLVMLAAYHGHSATVEALLARGADPNRMNDRGQSPLAGAVFKSEVEVVEVLLAGGADPFAGTPSALETARMFENVKLIRLLEKGYPQSTVD